MGPYTEIITQIKPKNDANFGVADVNDLIGGYIQVNTNEEMQLYLTKYSRRLKVGMLCYVIDENKFYQYRYEAWNPWVINNEQTPIQPGGAGVQVVETIEDAEEYATLGQIIYVQDQAQLYYYSPTGWRTFTRIYIQDEAPSDIGGLWIDTDDPGFEQSNDFTKSLLKMVNALSRRVSQLEYMNQQIQSGKFDNNMYDIYGNIIDIDPAKEITGDEPTTQEWDDDNTELLNNTLLADSQEPTYYKDLLPNVKHIQIKWGRYDDMQKYKDLFLPAELLWCYDKRQLWIKDPHSYQLIQIGTAQASGDVTDDDIMNGIIQDSTEQYIQSITFVDMLDSTKHYSFSVQNGELDLHDQSLDTYPKAIDTQLINGQNSGFETMKSPYIPTNTVYSATFPMLEINAVYGAEYDKFNYCDYNFIELANRSPEDINLNGMYLHYTEDGQQWITLPLKGIIKARHTFLIRGAKAADPTYAAIHIKSSDMYWTKDLTLNTNSLSNINKTFDSNNLIVLNDSCSLLLTGPLTSSVNGNDNITPTRTLLSQGFNLANPWVIQGTTPYVICGFIDLVGFGTGMPCISNPQTTLQSNKLYVKYYNLDPTSQAYKSSVDAAGGNDKMWTYINLETPDQEINLSKWDLEKGGHTLFFDKHKFEDGKPTVITCTFGYNPHTTRCFTWVSKGYRDEFIKYRKQGDSEWTIKESFKAGDGRETYVDDIYNRIRAVASDGVRFTSHKIIITLDEPTDSQVYEYQVGYGDFFTDIRTFTLRSRQKVINEGFSFVQVTDQQGFNAEEYNTWRLAAEYINQQSKIEGTEESKIQFTINTGDATQNGNRMGEWIDYFNAGNSLFDHFEQMYSVGNNDLCPIIPQEFGDGSDLTKCNPINVEFFFTFDHPDDHIIPKSTTGKYIPCCYSFIYGKTLFLGVNSELTDSKNNAAATLFGSDTNTLYNQWIKPWAQTEVDIADEFGVDWKIAFCHENPFTLLIADTFNGYHGTTPDSKDNHRGTVTSHFNIPGGFWFSKFLEDNKFNLSICGHKHTYTTSYYLHDNPEDRMKPYVYAESGQSIEADAQKVVQLTTDTQNMHFVKYTMCQATGYKLVSNKELPCQNIGWLEHYYPITNTGGKNKAQEFPHYIVWNIGVGVEKTKPSDPADTERPRILGRVKKLVRKDIPGNLVAKYNYNTAPLLVKDVMAIGGNGAGDTSNDNVIVEKLT